MDAPSATSLSPSPEHGGQVRRRGWRLWPVVLLLFAGLFGPCAAVQVPQEMGRWRLAQAVKHRAAGNKAAASENLTAALQWLPKSPELIITRAEWLLEEGQRDEALAEVERVLEVAGESEAALQVHAHFLQNVGEFQPAVDDWAKIVRRSEVSGRPPLATAKNGLAYAQALAEVELEAALDNVNDALAHEPENPALLDTRAYIYYLRAKSQPEEEAQQSLAAAIQDIDPAVKSMDRLLAQASPAGANEPPQVKMARDGRPKALRDMDPTYANAARSAAVLYYHRALILEALGRKKEAQAERKRAERLIGRPPDATLF